MVGIFQIFGINFAFWSFVGFLRFVLEHFERVEPRFGTCALCSTSTLVGIAVHWSTFLTLLFLLQIPAIFYYEPLSIEALIAIAGLWVVASGLGAYSAVRVCPPESYLLATTIGIANATLGYASIYSEHHFGTTGALMLAATFLFLSVVPGIIGAYLAKRVIRTRHEQAKRKHEDALYAKIEPEEVAVVIAAYNEELTIGSTIRSLFNTTQAKHIYVGNDGSSDKTAAVVRALGCHVSEIRPNGGKAAALARVIREYALLERYKAIFFVDADVTIGEGILQSRLPQFDDPEVAAVIGRTNPLWPEHSLPQWRYFFTAYRLRLWLVLRYCLRYGQTWRYLNAAPIIPGGGSIYRTSVLRKIRIDVPGLVIEDFNMTFCVHHQKLGRVSFEPTGPFNTDQEPFSLNDYVKQIWRWYLGFFQTVRYHGAWPSWFFISMALFNIEMVLSSVFFLMTPLLLAQLLLGGGYAALLGLPLHAVAAAILAIVVAYILLDYLMTVVIAIAKQKPLLLIYGFAFPILRYVDSAVFLRALVVGLFMEPKNSGSWVSPRRIAYSSSSSAKTS